MNTNYLKVKIKIPIDYDNPDMNGAIYTKEAYAKAMTYGTTSLPLTIYDNEGNPISIGAFESIGFDCKVNKPPKEINNEDKI